MGGVKLTYKGVVDLTPEQTSSKGTTNETEMSRSKQRIKIEELAIRDEENVYDTNTGGIDQGEQTSSLEK